MCRFCIAQCGVLITVNGDRVLKVRGDRAHPLTQGYICSQGRALGRAHHDPTRLDHASTGRGAARRNRPVPDVLDDLGRSLEHIRRANGPDAVAFFFGTDGRADTAGAMVAQRLATALGTESVYTNGTLDAVAKLTAMRMMAGHTSMYCLPDLEEARLLALFGANPVVSKGHTWALPDPVRALRAVRRLGEVWVFDPRRSETAALATRHVALRPGSDSAVLAYVLNELLHDGADDAYLAKHASGVAGLRDAVAAYTLDVAARRASVDPTDLEDFVRAVRRYRRLAALSGTGVGFSPCPTVTEWLVLALNVVTGSMEAPGGVWFHPGFWFSAQAVCTTPLPPEPARGPAARPELVSWVPGQRPATGLIDDIEAGNVQALVIVGGNPLTSFPHTAHVRAALGRIKVLAVADVVEGDMCELATHVLPCTGQLERGDVNAAAMFQPAVYGTVVPPVVPRVADRMPEWWFMAELGRRLGLEVLPAGVDASSSDLGVLRALFPDPLVPFDEVAAASNGITVDVDRSPWVTTTVLADGRWELAPPRVVAEFRELTDGTTPLALISRRQPHHNNSTLRGIGHDPGRDAPLLYVNEADGARLGIVDGTPVRVSSTVGSVVTTACLDPTLRGGVVALPHGFRDVNVNDLTDDRWHVDDISGMPRYSSIPVTVEPLGAGTAHTGRSKCSSGSDSSSGSGSNAT